MSIFSVSPVEIDRLRNNHILAAGVSNNILALAISSGSIWLLDQTNPEKIQVYNLPRKPADPGPVSRLFIDPTGSHIIISTANGITYHLQNGKKEPRVLSIPSGTNIQAVGWPPDKQSDTLFGDSKGNVYELNIDETGIWPNRSSLQVVKKVDSPVTGFWIGSTPQGERRLLVATTRTLHYFHFEPQPNNRLSYRDFFRGAKESLFCEPLVYNGRALSGFALSPVPPNALHTPGLFEQSFAWVSSPRGVHYTKLPSPDDPKNDLLSSLDFKPNPGEGDIRGLALSQWHIILFVGNELIITNQLDGSIVLRNSITTGVGDGGFLGLAADGSVNTYWLFTRKRVFKITPRDETQDLWRILLNTKDFSRALDYSDTPEKRDYVSSQIAEFHFKNGDYSKAAEFYSRSSKPFEQVTLAFMERSQYDALRTYLLARLEILLPDAKLQRTMLATWLTELFMSKLNELDDLILTQAETQDSQEPSSTERLDTVRKEFQSFVHAHKADLDTRATYSIISNHSREEELLFYATSIEDNNYVLNYWVQRERWPETLGVLRRQMGQQPFYKYATVLMGHIPSQTIDLWMRRPDLDATKLIPALLDYNRLTDVPLRENEAIRYLLFQIRDRKSTDPAIHNTLLSLYASNSSPSEDDLLRYLDEQSIQHHDQPLYDIDFALRLCVQHNRVRSCIHIFQSMGQHAQAVDLALRYGETELASTVAEKSDVDNVMRKRLWLAIAKKVISGTVDGAIAAQIPSNGDQKEEPVADKPRNSIQEAVKFLKRCPLLKIQDLIPLLPDFFVIDDFREQIYEALGEYTQQITDLREEMNDSASTAAQIRADIAALDQRFVLVTAGERCWLCGLALLARPFFVFPSCQHGFHADCLATKIKEAHYGSAKIRSKKLLRLASKEAEEAKDGESVREGRAETKREIPYQGSVRQVQRQHSRASVATANFGPVAGPSTPDSRTAAGGSVAGEVSSQMTHPPALSISDNTSVHSDTIDPAVDSDGEDEIGALARRIEKLQHSIPKASGRRKEEVAAELDSLVSDSCVLCGEIAIREISEPFIYPDEDEWVQGWAL